MDHDVTAEVRAAVEAGGLAILGVRVVQSHRQVIEAVGIQRIDAVEALWYLPVALGKLGAGVTAGREDRIRADFAFSAAVGREDLELRSLFDKEQDDGARWIGDSRGRESGLKAGFGGGAVLRDAIGDGCSALERLQGGNKQARLEKGAQRGDASGDDPSESEEARGHGGDIGTGGVRGAGPGTGRYASAVELTPLRYFKAIAEARHMTRAAETLGVTQPALSAMLRKLEAEVGAELLHRTGKGVELTDAGRAFLVHAEEALRAAGQGVVAVRQLMGLESGSIRVGGGATATTYLLPPVVSAVRRKYAGLRFYVREAGSSTVAAAVLSGELDLGIVTLPVAVPGMRDLLTIPLVEDELRLIVPPGGSGGKGRSEQGAQGVAKGVRPLRRGQVAANSGAWMRGKSFRWKDLDGTPFVSFEAGTAVRELIDSAAKAAGVKLDVVMELRSIESIKSMVAAGIGVGLVSRFALAEDQGMSCRDGKLSRTLAVVRRRDRIPSRAAAEFERMLVKARE